MHWTSTFVDVGSGERYTDGPTAVALLHGLGEAADIWRPLMARRRPPALGLDLPGSGRSPWLEPDANSAPNLAAQVVDALDEREIIRRLLNGHSLVARMCIDLAARTALRAKGCTLIDISAGGSRTRDFGLHRRANTKPGWGTL